MLAQNWYVFHLPELVNMVGIYHSGYNPLCPILIRNRLATFQLSSPFQNLFSNFEEDKTDILRVILLPLKCPQTILE